MDQHVMAMVFEEGGASLTATRLSHGDLVLEIDEIGADGPPTRFQVSAHDAARLASSLLTLAGAKGITYRLPWATPRVEEMREP